MADHGDVLGIPTGEVRIRGTNSGDEFGEFGGQFTELINFSPHTFFGGGAKTLSVGSGELRNCSKIIHSF